MTNGKLRSEIKMKPTPLQLEYLRVLLKLSNSGVPITRLSILDALGDLDIYLCFEGVRSMVEGLEKKGLVHAVGLTKNCAIVFEVTELGRSYDH